MAAGAAVPVGDASDLRDTGPSAALSLETQLSTRLLLRLDGEWTRLQGPSAPPGQERFSTYQDLRAVGASMNVLFRLIERKASPYVLAGGGAYQLQRIDAPRSPYGTTAALQAGFGMDGKIWERLNPFVEARAVVHLTDYGSHDFSLTTYWPLMLGLRLQ